MSDNIEFQDWRPEKRKEKTPAMVSLLLKTGLVKDENQANKVLLGITVIATILAIYFFAKAF